MKKRFIAFTTAVLVAMSCILATACTSDPNTTTPTSSAQAATQAPTEPKTDAPTAAPTLSQEENEIVVSIQIEGADKQYYYGKVSTKETTVYGVLTALDAIEDSFEMEFLDSSYGGKFLNGVGAETTAQFGGWDGWMFSLNGELPYTTVDETTITDDDVIVVFYADPYGVGMQYPEMDITKLSEGVVTFTSKDVTYDADGNAHTGVNPVAGMTVEWKYDGKCETYITDEAGQITLTQTSRVPGTYQVAVHKEAENGCPLVLRFGEDIAVTIFE